MTSSHIFYIPLIFLVGLVVGTVLGRRSAVVQIEEEARKAERKQARRAALERVVLEEAKQAAVAPPSEPEVPSA
ncbi:MAG: hypothetical protein ACI9MR_000303 [Myxococcota bacterium]|jgi:hypothetical protein